jgi:hypothetical protein
MFMLSLLAGAPLVWGVVFLTRLEGPLAIPGMLIAGWLFPAMTLIYLWRRGYRCGVCGSRCAEVEPPPGRWRYLCPGCDIAWDINKPESGAAA